MQSNRFHSPTESTPGPGTYKLSSKWVKKIYHATEKDNVSIICYSRLLMNVRT